MPAHGDEDYLMQQVGHYRDDPAMNPSSPGFNRYHDDPVSPSGYPSWYKFCLAPFSLRFLLFPTVLTHLFSKPTANQAPTFLLNSTALQPT